MKKLLVLAMVLVLAVPMFAEMSIGGEFDYYMVNGFKSVDLGDPAQFVDRWDKGEVDFKASVGDYSQVRIEIEEDGTWNGSERLEVADTGDGVTRNDGEGNPSFNYFRVITDWGKFFGLDGIGIKTDIGLNSWETKDGVDFTGYNYEYFDNWEQPLLTKDFGAKIDLSFVDGLVQPYFAWVFDTITYKDAYIDADRNAEFLVGSGFDFNAIGLPLWLEAYYYDTDEEKVNEFAVEAMYDLTIGDMEFKLGGYLASMSNGDDRGERWGFGVGFNAFGATINVSAGGCFGKDYWEAEVGEDAFSAFSVLGIDAQYDILDWLAVNAGFALAFGDYKENAAADKTLQDFEAGVIVKPDKGVCYKLGYIYCDKKIGAGNPAEGEGKGDFFRTLNTKGLTAEKGGLYFVTKIDF